MRHEVWEVAIGRWFARIGVDRGIGVMMLFNSYPTRLRLYNMRNPFMNKVHTHMQVEYNYIEQD